MSSSISDTSAATPLRQRQCAHQNGAPLNADEQRTLLGQLQGWQIEADQDGALTKTFILTNFHRTMAFVNAVAWIAHEQDHHPDMAVSYKQCTLRWSTHSVGGLSINDFICAARVDALSA